MRARSAGPADKDRAGRVRQVARIAAGGTCGGRARVCLKHCLAAVNPWFGTNSAALALILSEFFRVPDHRPAVAFTRRIWHRSAVGDCNASPPTFSDAGVAQW